MNTAPNTPCTWRKHILIPGDKLYRGQKSVGRNQRQMETFATEDIVKIVFKWVPLWVEKRAVAGEKQTFNDALSTLSNQYQYSFKFS